MEVIYMEEWKDIIGYEGLYKISSWGRVWSCRRNAYRKPVFTGKYYQIKLCKNGVVDYPSIHRLVAQHFLDNPNNLPEVNHKDENKLNNHVDNLEWCTHEYNTSYGTRNSRIGKANSKPVICIETGIIYSSVMEAERQTGIHNGNIIQVCNGRRKTAGKYHWRYEDAK